MRLGSTLHKSTVQILRLILAVLFTSGSLGPPIAWASAESHMNAWPAGRAAVSTPLLVNDVTPSVNFSASTYRGYETDGTIPITVTLSASAALTATVDYTTSPGSAQPGTDYTAINGTLTFSPGVASQTVNLPLLDNPLGQADQTLTATLSNPVNASLGVTTSALVVIGDSETTVLTVTKSADTNHGACETTDCSLREAVIAANAYPGPNTIILPAGVYTLSLPGANEFAAATGDLNINGDLTLQGATSATSVITTTGAAFGDRVFQIAPSTTMTVSDVTVSGGYLPSGNGGGFYNQGTLFITNSTIYSNTAQYGGGISNGGVLQLVNSMVISNYSSQNGGGVSNNAQFQVVGSTFAGNQAYIEGGGIASDKPAQVISTTFTGNQAWEGGGLSAITGIDQPGVVITGSTFDHNLAQSGGGLHSTGNVTVTQSTFSHNQATICGGAIEVWPQADISNSFVVSNTAPDGGGICATGITTLSSTMVLSNSATNRGGGVWSAMRLTATNDTIAGNSAAGDGGGIYNDHNSGLLLSDSTVANNLASSADPTRGNGGGIYNIGAFTSTNTSLSGNSASGNGGGLYDNANPASLPIVGPTALNNITVTANVAGQGNGSGNGGGIFALSILQLSDSQVISNSANTGGGIYSNYDGTISQTQILSNTASNKGGGISASGLFQITGSTLAANKAELFGSGLFVYSGTAASVDSSNFVGNQAADSFPIGAIDNQGSLTVTNSAFYDTIGNAVVNYLGHLTLASSVISNSNSIGLLNEDGTAVITGSTITENPVGGVGNEFGIASMIVINSVFSSNANPFVGSGGGAIKSFGSLAITGSSFISNSAAGGGSAIYSNPANGLRISQSTFTNNTDTAIYNIGTGFPTSAIFITDSVFSNNTNGGAIFNEADLLTVVSTTFSANSGNRAAAIYLPKDIGAVGLIVRSSAFYSNTSTSDAGAIQAANTPTILANSTFSGNRAAENAGAILVVNSTATLSNLTLSGNVAGSDGGALYVDTNSVATVDNTQFVSNTSTAADGAGGIYSAGILTVTNGSILDTAGVGLHNYHGHVLVESTLISNSASYGLLNDTGTMVITGSTITRNPGGGARNNLSSAANGMTVINSLFSKNSDNTTGTNTAGGGGAGGGAIASYGSQLAITNSNFISNSATQGPGGAIWSFLGLGLSITDSIFAGNTQGAIFNEGGSFAPTVTVSIADSVFSNNQDGAIDNQADNLSISNSTFFSNTSPSSGAAVNNDSWSLTISGSAFYSNTSASDGGAVWNYFAPTTITNSTFSGNQAADNAGAIWFVRGPATLNNVTIAGNTASHSHSGAGGGGLVVSGTAVVTATNTIIAGNIDLGGQAPDCAGTLTTGGHNLIQSTAGCTLSGTASGDVIGQPALLGPLQDNGGPTWTRALLPGSPAIDGGSPAAPGSGGAACEVTDQRGVVRPQGLACDIGAYEAAGLTATATVQFAGSAFTGTQTAGSIPITVTLSRLMPVTVTVQYSTTDGSALAGSDYAAATGVVTFTPGVTQTAFSVAVLPDGPFETNEAFSVSLSAPANATLGVPNTATVTIVDDEPPPSVALSSNQYTVAESAGSVVISATLSAASALTATVHYSTTDGTAVSGADYLARSGTLTFTPGVTLTTFTVSIVQDNLHEADESFGVVLSSPAGAVLAAPSTAAVTIHIDAPAPLVSFASSQYTVTESAGPALITATLSAASELTATVHYTTSGGSALAGQDYLTATGTLTFTPGMTQTALSISIVDDNLYEAGQAFGVALSLPAGATLAGPYSATVNILDGDPPPLVSFISSQYTVTESGGSAIITATLSSASGLTATVDFATSDGTAQAGSDYTPVSGTLTFAPGQLQRVFTVPISNDPQLEGAETIQLTLSGPAQATLGSPTAATLTIVEIEFRQYLPFLLRP